MGPCNPGDARTCYTGASGTQGVGPCVGGNQTCTQGGVWSDCVGQVVPAPEMCGDNVDNNCNGMTDEDVDADGDGYTSCGGDCCDDPTVCGDPAEVNPGAIEVAGDGIDNDCDGMIDNATTAICDMGLNAASTDPMDFAKAIDLCQTTTMTDKKWGVISAKYSKTDGTGSPVAYQHSLPTGYGTGVTPKNGSALAILATGHADATTDAQTDTEGAASAPYPADFYAANGNMLPNAPGCPAPFINTANNPVMVTLQIRVPTNAKSFTIDSNFYSSEFPEYVCNMFNDFFVILLDSQYNGSPPNPADKNLAFYSPDMGTTKYPVGVNLAHGDTGLFTQCVNGKTGCAGGVAGNISTCTGVSELQGTSFATADDGDCSAGALQGGATGWLETSGNVKPGEIITLRIAIWNVGDSAYQSLALIDSFQWSAEGSDPGTVIERTVEPLQPVSTQTGLAVPVSGSVE
jgi:hypothetical protein